MQEKNKIIDKIIFGLEIAFLIILLVVLCWKATPTNILNSTPAFELLETIGIYGPGIILLAGMPVGIIGIIRAKKNKKLRTVTTVLSVINLSAACFEILVLLVIFCAVIFGGASV